MFTTHGTKIWSLTHLTASLLKNAVRISEDLFTVCESVYNERTVAVSPEEAITLAFRQLARFRDHDDGSVSGKSGGTEEDDAGMAILLAVRLPIHPKSSHPPRELAPSLIACTHPESLHPSPPHWLTAALQIQWSMYILADESKTARNG